MGELVYARDKEWAGEAIWTLHRHPTPDGWTKGESGTKHRILYAPLSSQHLIALPVRRGKTYDKETGRRPLTAGQRSGLLTEIDPKSLTVHHQFTFSSFSPGRKNLLDNFVNPTEVPKNATEHQRIQAHSDWEQWSE
jgi:hypothetical protein